ncbi:MAG TPA: flagellar basal-body rod protein FlgF [Methylocella sp.]|nr:flagellar basal-body rod protein FlgF [Methylocella sp.]
MQSSFYVTLSAQAAIDRRLATLAANVANQSTPGYRAEQVDFKTVLSRSGNTQVAYVAPGETYISRRPGVPYKTGDPLDVALQGDCWLALRTPSGVVYTRDGRMRMAQSGDLQSVNGYPVLDAGSSPVTLDPNAGPVTIAPDGMISQGGRQMGAIGLFRIDESATLRRFDNSSVISSKPATPVLDFTRNSVTQGYVEGANVNPVLEIEKLISLSRTFESISAAIEISESSLKDAIRILGGLI